MYSLRLVKISYVFVAAMANDVEKEKKELEEMQKEYEKLKAMEE